MCGFHTRSTVCPRRACCWARATRCSASGLRPTLAGSKEGVLASIVCGSAVSGSGARHRWSRSETSFVAASTGSPPTSTPAIRLPSGKRHAAGVDVGRSEEHTSELQSRQYLVCRLLLEKKRHKPRLVTIFSHHKPAVKSNVTANLNPITGTNTRILTCLKAHNREYRLMFAALTTIAQIV